MKRFLSVLSLAILTLLLVACGGKGEPSTATIVTEGNGGVFEVTVTIDAKKKVTEVEFEEYIGLDTDYTLELSDESDAEFIKVNEKLFALENGKYVLDGVEFATWVKDDANAKYYVDAIKADKVIPTDSEGKALEATFSNVYIANGFGKSSNGYWPADMFPGSGKGWQENIDNLVEAVKGKKLSTDDKLEMIEDTTNWKVNGVDSSSSFTSFKDYYLAVVKGYEAALE